MPKAPSSVSGNNVVTVVKRFLGLPYVWGADGPSSFDCSGLVQYVYKQLGIKLPRTSEEQYTATTPISRDQLLPGDLVFAAGSDGTTARPGHVGIYIGEHSGVPTVVEAPHTGANVRYTPLSGFSASGYRRVSAVNGTGTGIQDASFSDSLGGLLQFPGEIVQFFGKATDDLSAAGQFFYAFTQPSTWVRVGTGGLGLVLLIGGLVFLIKSGAANE